MDRKYKLKLDLQFNCRNVLMKFDEFDKDTSDFFLNVTRNRKEIDINNSIVTLVAIKPSKEVEAQFIEVQNNSIYANLKPSMKDEVGKYQAIASITLEGETVNTGIFEYEVTENNLLKQLNEDISTDERFTILTDMINRLSSIETNENNRVEAEKLREEVIVKIKADAKQEITEYKEAKDAEINSNLSKYKSSTTDDIEEFKSAKSQELDDFKDAKNSEIDDYKKEKDLAINQYIQNKNLQLDEYVKTKNSEIDKYKEAKDKEIDLYKSNKDTLINNKIAEVEASKQSIVSTANNKISELDQAKTNMKNDVNSKIEEADNRISELQNFETQLEHIETQMNNVTPLMTTFISEGENKLNITSSECKHGYFLNWDNTEQVKKGVSISHKIPVRNGDIICFSRCHLTSTNWGILYDKDDSKICGLNSIGMEFDENEDSYKYKKVVINKENASYIRINFLTNDIKVKPMLFFSSGFPLNYIPYKLELNKNININLGKSVNYNILENKTVLTFGDSVMYGAGGTVGAFAKMIADKNNMTLINKAKSGYTICVNTDYPSRGSILKEVEKSIYNNDNADYILIEGGFNDVFVKSKCPIGTISSDYITFDDNTFTGALESLFKQVLTKWYDKKILFILGHQIYRSINDESLPFDYWIKNQNTYWNRAIEICKKWNVPFLDMRLSGFIPLTDELLIKYFTESNQSTHPNDLGYELIYVDKVENKMKSL